MRSYKTYVGGGALVGLTLLSGAVLTAPKASADTSSTVDVTVNVPAACTLSATNNNLTKTINPGTFDTIGTANLKAVCNDPDGFAIYAIGYTDNIHGNNYLTTELGEDYKIATGTAESGDTSNWSMTIGNNAEVTSNYTATIDNGFDTAHIIPDTNTKIATVTSVTDQSIGTNLTAKFDAYISPAQASGTYQGKVKFTLVHPNPDINRRLYMQNVDEWKDSIEIGQSVYAVDMRDNQGYVVAKLADGRVWMTENLKLDLENATITAENTNNPTDSFLTEAVSATSSGSTLCEDYTTECDDQIQYTTVNIGDTTIDSYGRTHDEYGVYYNWYTATAGNGVLAMKDIFESKAVGDICPSGWHLPEAETSNIEHNDFWKLTSAIIGTDPANGASWTGDPEGTNASAAMRAQPNNFVYSGAILGSNILLQGTFGTWWSSTMGNNRGDPFALGIQDNMVQFRNLVMSPHAGASVRCVASDGPSQSATLDTGRVVGTKMKTLAAGTVKRYDMSTEDIKSVKIADNLPTDFEPTALNTISAPGSAYPVYIFFDNTDDAGIMYIYTEGDKITLDSDSRFLFASNLALTEVPASTIFDTSNVTNMQGMFYQDESLTSLDASNWDTSKVTNMNIMFSGAKSLVTVNTTGWDTSHVTSMGAMFAVGDDHLGNGMLQEIIGIGSWDVSNVTNMGSMFYGAGQMTHYDIANWDVSKVESFNHTFCDNFGLESLDLSRWNVSSVKTMYDMFDDAYALTTIGDVSHWNTANLIDVGGWLNGASSFVGNNGMLDLSSWNTSNLKAAGEMFRATKLQTIDLSGWTFDSITNDSWEGAGSGIYPETGNTSSYKGLAGMFLNMPQLQTVYVSQSGLNSYNNAVTRGVDITNMWSGSNISGFTVKP